jgi:Hint domain
MPSYRGPGGVRRLVLLAVTVLAVGGCAGAAPTGAASPSATTPPPSTTVASPSASNATTTQTVWQLRYRLLVHYPDFAYCDPDLYPVARMDEQPAADDWWAGASPASPEVAAILAHHGYHGSLTADQRLTAYRDHKRLTVIAMTAVSGGYQYELSIGPGGEPDQRVFGMITFVGEIHEASREPRPGGCPICLDTGTRIATPHGDVPVALIRPGDVVWTADGRGHRIARPVLRIARRATPGPHLMLRLALSDGRTLVVAGAHPAADGTYLRALHRGQPYDGAAIVSIGWILSTAAATFDILPAGSTGTYWADGILVGSTLS